MLCPSFFWKEIPYATYLGIETLFKSQLTLTNVELELASTIIENHIKNLINVTPKIQDMVFSFLRLRPLEEKKITQNTAQEYIIPFT